MENLFDMSYHPLFLEGGGQLIPDEFGEVVGAVGINGDVNETDDECAFAGIKKAGFHVDPSSMKEMASVKASTIETNP
jgi:uncharacterized protein GlcG (DUF336 family)